MRWFTDWFRRSDGTAARIGRGSIFRGGRLRGEAADRVVRRRGATGAETARPTTGPASSPAEAGAAAAVGGAVLLGVEAIDVFGLYAPGPHSAAAKSAGEGGAAAAAPRDAAPAEPETESSTHEFHWAGNDSDGDGDGGGDSGGDGGGD